ncbi:MAG: polyribonucleotide nucleotidyltransferase, partial [Myxococcota bacterium]|nr:polyribonucleotide nucleotidyltransferase [Myxococcota bacterium]
MFDIKTKTIDIGGRPMTIETGLMAKQAGGSVTVCFGDSMVLATCTVDSRVREGIDFLPLTCDYIVRTQAGGKIPGGFFKREGKLSEYETLTSRLIDRPTRPLFPKGFNRELQIVVFVLSADKINDTDILGMNGASTAAMISDAPFQGPYGAVRVGRVDGELIANPTFEQREAADMDLIVAATREAIVTVEGGCQQVSEAAMLDALEFAHESILPILDAQEALAAEVAKDPVQVTLPVEDTALIEEVESRFGDAIKTAMLTEGKLIRRAAVKSLRGEIIGAMVPDGAAEGAEARTKGIKKAVEKLVRKILRTMLIEEGKRIDGRGPDEIRFIDARVGVLPRTHGSSLFTRGETQGLVVATLGTDLDSQKIETLHSDTQRRFILHYNFPPFSVNEVRFMRGPGRREIGHGALAHRALTPVMPSKEEFPYVVRVVSDILESNGSSSMASVCGGSLSMMDAGVPLKAPVAGIAMGLVKEGDKAVVLSDILGDEDHLGDMDFKVTGTAEGITAFQMDTKIGGISREIMEQALNQAREGRLHILGEMAKGLSAHREEINQFAPRIHVIKINPDRIRDVIGPGGKMIRSIVERTQCKIDVEDSGNVSIASPDGEACKRAIKMIQELTQEAEVGKMYLGLVKKVTDFGAFVEIFPGTDGLCHISELANYRVKQVTDIITEGDEVLVKCIEVDSRS